jgi:hypothetical protein
MVMEGDGWTVFGAVFTFNIFKIDQGSIPAIVILPFGTGWIDAEAFVTDADDMTGLEDNSVEHDATSGVDGEEFLDVFGVRYIHGCRVMVGRFLVRHSVKSCMLA